MRPPKCSPNRRSLMAISDARSASQKSGSTPLERALPTSSEAPLYLSPGSTPEAPGSTPRGQVLPSFPPSKGEQVAAPAEAVVRRHTRLCAVRFTFVAKRGTIQPVRSPKRAPGRVYADHKKGEAAHLVCVRLVSKCRPLSSLPPMLLSLRCPPLVALRGTFGVRSGPSRPQNTPARRAA